MSNPRVSKSRRPSAAGKATDTRKPGSPRGKKASGPTSLVDFIACHQVFRFDEAAEILSGSSRESLAAGLHYHCTHKRIVRFRRGLYCRVPLDDVDPFLIGSRVTSDAVLGYEGALRLHAGSSLGHGIEVLTQERFTPFVHMDIVYRPVRLEPRSATELKRGPRFRDGIVEVEREGLPVWVCTEERAFADCFDRPDLSSGLEEIAGWFFHQRDLDPKQLAAHARANGSRIGAARLGLFMEAHRQLRHSREAKALLAELRPKTPTVFDPAHRDGGHLVSRWNAIIPDWFLQIRQNLL